MPIQFTCPHCGHSAQVADQVAGQSGPCAKCKQTITIPAVEQAPSSGVTPPPEQQPPAPKKSRLGCWIVLMILAIIVVLLVTGVFGWFAITEARIPACGHKMKQLGLAMHDYHDRYRRFPCAIPAEEGYHTHPWRVAILPFIEQLAIFNQFKHDEPWDSEHNLAVAAKLDPAVFQCPGESPQYKEIKGHKIPVSSYVMIVSEQRRRNPESTIGSTEPGDGASIGDIADGTRDTIMLVEVKGDDRPAWCEPVDIDLKSFVKGFNAGPGTSGSKHPGGCNVLMCDGVVYYLTNQTPTETLKLMACRRDGRSLPKGTLPTKRKPRFGEQEDPSEGPVTSDTR